MKKSKGMKVTIIKGPKTNENIQKCYQYIVELYRKKQKVEKK